MKIQSALIGNYKQFLREHAQSNELCRTLRGVGAGWFKRLFIDKEYQGNENPNDYIFIPARIYDNKVLMNNNPEYVQHLVNLPEDLRKEREIKVKKRLLLYW